MWCEFMLLGQVSDRFALIGDPGQIPPVITIPTARWETAPRPPHLPAPEIILERFRSQDARAGAPPFTTTSARQRQPRPIFLRL